MSSSDRVRHPLPRVTTRAFTDLALWMIGFGLLIGSTFPWVITAFGLPREQVIRPGFFAATLGAGLLVAALNHQLARAVVRVRLVALSSGMQKVAEMIQEATLSGDWTKCSPQQCGVLRDSDDELGDAAESFNLLLHVLADSREVEQLQNNYVHALAEHLDLDEVGAVALHGALEVSRAAAGAVMVVEQAQLRTIAAHRLDPQTLTSSSLVAHCLRSSGACLVEIPPGLAIDAGMLAFRPAAVAVVPVHFSESPIGVIVLGFADVPGPERLRLLEHLAAPTGVALHNALDHERYQALAVVDPLTGAFNRRFGTDRLEEEFARSVRHADPLGVIAFDLDHFKLVNDRFGHLVGDQLLCDVAAAATAALRAGDVLVRTGGEEFMVILPRAATRAVAEIAERVRRTIALTETWADGAPVQVTASFGALSMPSVPAETPQEALQLVDRALYRSKHAGRDRVTICTNADSLAGEPRGSSAAPSRTRGSSAGSVS